MPNTREFHLCSRIGSDRKLCTHNDAMDTPTARQTYLSLPGFSASISCSVAFCSAMLSVLPCRFAITPHLGRVLAPKSLSLLLLLCLAPFYAISTQWKQCVPISAKGPSLTGNMPYSNSTLPLKEPSQKSVLTPSKLKSILLINNHTPQVIVRPHVSTSYLRLDRLLSC